MIALVATVLSILALYAVLYGAVVLVARLKGY